MRFLFWNLYNSKKKENKKIKLLEYIVKIIKIYQIDLIAFAEFGFNRSKFLRVINSHIKPLKFFAAPIEDGEGNPLEHKIEVFSNFSPKFLTNIFDQNIIDTLSGKVYQRRITIRRLKLKNKPEILIAIVHLQSKIHYDDPESQFEVFRRLSNLIKIAEHQARHKRTILFGDLNSNPFENNIINLYGLHGIMNRNVINNFKRGRKLEDEKFDFFYNPMWKFYSDENRISSGSHYYYKAKSSLYFWNVFDQVLVRRELIKCLDMNFLQILEEINGESLLSKRGYPKREISDHLPIIFRLKNLGD